MIEAKYDSSRDFDSVFLHIIEGVYDKLNVGEDDFLLLCCGTPGTGKSMLMLHALDDYLKKEASIDYVGLDKEDFARALRNTKDKPLPRFCANDEANISKRDSLAKYNKELIDLYLSIRGLRIFHWWNNPSLDILDKHFIEERIKGVIYIATKETKRPRTYYYFRKKDLLKLWEKYGNLKLNLLKKVKKQYAYYKGWFKDYNGPLKAAYMLKKNKRMDVKVDGFFDKYGLGEEGLTTSMIKKTLGLSSPSICKYEKEAIKNGMIKEDEIKRTITGRVIYPKKILSIFEGIAKEKHSNIGFRTLESPNIL